MEKRKSAVDGRGVQELEPPDDDEADELPDLAGALDDEVDESEVSLDEDPEDSLLDDESLPLEPESDDEPELDVEPELEDSDAESLDFFLAPLVSARESLR